MNKVLSRTIAIVLLVLTVVLLGYAIWSVAYAHDYVSSLIEMGQVAVEEDRYSVVNFYMSNSAEYFVYSVIFAVAGITFLTLPAKEAKEKVRKEKVKKVVEEEK